MVQTGLVVEEAAVAVGERLVLGVEWDCGEGFEVLAGDSWGGAVEGIDATLVCVANPGWSVLAGGLAEYVVVSLMELPEIVLDE